MRKNFRTWAASLMAGALTVGMLATPVMADTFSYTPLAGPATVADGAFEFDKDFEMSENATIPEATFNYTVTPGAKIDPAGGNAGVLAGVGTPTIESVVYEVADSDAVINATGKDVPTGKKVATKKTFVDLSGCSFTEPGIYRYIVTESGTNTGVTNDPILTRTLDVYVVNEETEGTEAVLYTQEDVDAWVAENPDADPSECPFAVGDVKTPATPASTSLAIDGYVFYEGTKTDAPSKTATEATGKSEGYRNTYESYDLTFGKEVKGSFGSLDQYFPFTVTIDAPEGTVLTVDLSDADATPHDSDANVANGTTPAANPTELTAGADGITQVFWIHDGQYITIRDLPYGCDYEVTEDAGDYTATEGIVAADNDEGVAHSDATSGTMTTAVKTGFTNTREVVTPTGIQEFISSYGPAVGIILAVVALFGVFGVVSLKKKRQ